jgi:hypothetical protein
MCAQASVRVEALLDITGVAVLPRTTFVVKGLRPDASSAALLVANSTPSRKLLPKLAGFAAFHKQQVHDTAASRAKDLMCLEDRS